MSTGRSRCEVVRPGAAARHGSLSCCWALRCGCWLARLRGERGLWAGGLRAGAWQGAPVTWGPWLQPTCWGFPARGQREPGWSLDPEQEPAGFSCLPGLPSGEGEKLARRERPGRGRGQGAGPTSSAGRWEAARALGFSSLPCASHHVASSGDRDWGGRVWGGVPTALPCVGGCSPGPPSQDSPTRPCVPLLRLPSGPVCWPLTTAPASQGSRLPSGHPSSSGIFLESQSDKPFPAWSE